MGLSRTSGRAAGALEREVLASLAVAGRPLTAGEVLAELGGGLAYTTVMATLSRLHPKGALRREPAGRAYAYSLVSPLDALPASLTASRMRRLLDAEDDRASVLASFVAHLEQDDERLLAELLGRGRPADGAQP